MDTPLNPKNNRLSLCIANTAESAPGVAFRRDTTANMVNEGATPKRNTELKLILVNDTAGIPFIASLEGTYAKLLEIVIT